MQYCDDSEQMGSDWKQRMLMNMPAAAAAAAASASSSSSMAKAQEKHAVAAGPLRCPRCDSSNTKFCYYNNYSLSQPRHFCKACKRYWTRGGTLRNVPVGGGCRKNKRSVKKQQQTTGSAPVAANSDPPSSTLQPTSSDLTSFFYGLASASASAGTTSDMNLGSFSSTGAYDALGLGGLMIPSSNQLSSGLMIHTNNIAHLQQPSSSFLHNDYPASFGSQAASLLVSSLKQPKKVQEYGQSLLPCYEGLQQENLGFLKDVKVEGAENTLMGNNIINTEWQANYPFEANGSSDASFLYWNPAIGGAGWPDAANSSVAPLI